jgi:response regulator RpfG family c-di-GMP phosphodiesterase
MAGSIHDIGKLSIPADILAKPTKLSEIEFLLIKEHTRKGFEMLKDVESPWPLVEIVYQHYEHYCASISCTEDLYVDHNGHKELGHYESHCFN